jgi:hypothetical protein
MKDRLQSILTIGLLFSGIGFASEPVIETANTKEMAYEYKKGCKTPKSSKEDCITLEDQHPNYPCPDNWRLSGDFLYLLPTFDDTYFVLENSVFAPYPSHIRKNNDFGYSPGFRVGAEYAFCDTRREFQAFYSHLNSSEKKTVTGDHLWAAVGDPDIANVFENYSGSAASNLNVMYQHLDVNFSQQALTSYGMRFYIQPGVEYAYLRLREKYTFIKDNARFPSKAKIDEKSQFWGVGPQVGLVLDYNFLHETLSCSATHAFSILAQFSGSLLVGHAKTKNRQEGTFPIAIVIADILDQHTTRTIPALHARVGLNYNISGTAAGGALEIGYEFNSYLRALARSTSTDTFADGKYLTDYYNFDVQGLYVSAKLSF